MEKLADKRCLKKSLLECTAKAKTCQHKSRLYATDLREDVNHGEYLPLIDNSCARSQHMEFHQVVLLYLSLRHVLLDLPDLIKP